MTLTLTETALLRRLTAKKAMIITETQGGVTTHAAYPLGDRRRRAISWISAEKLARLLAEDVLEQAPKGYRIRASAKARSAHIVGSDNRHAAQHRTMETQSFSQEDGSFRSAHVNTRSRSTLYHLARKLDRDGAPFLSASQLEAGERLASDYARSMLAMSVTQNFENVSGPSGNRSGVQDSAASAMDAKRRYLEALDYVGPGLSRAITAICCEHMGMEQLEATQGWAKRSGKTVLKIGLDRLSQFYGTQPGLYAARRAQTPDTAISASR